MSEWKKYKLGDLILLNYGKGLKEADRIKGDYPVYSSAGINGYHKKSLTNSQGLIIGRKGTIGKIYYSERPFWCIDTAFYILPNNEKYNLKFLYYLLGTLRLDELNEDSAVPGLNRNTFYNLEVNLPSLFEQEKIAEVLSSLDDKIDLLYQENKTLEQLADTLFRKWIEGEEWNGTLTEYIKVQGGYAFKSKDFKECGYAGIIKIKNISMGLIDIMNTDFVDEEVVKNIDVRFKIKSGDFLIAMTGAEIGKIGIVENTEKEIWVNQRVGKLETKVPYGDLIGYLALKSREGQEHIINSCAGSAQENISSTGIEQMNFISYNKEKTNFFGKEVQQLFGKIIFNMGQIKILTNLRDILLPKLINGDMRMKI